MLLARRQGSRHVILPGPGDDPKAESIYSRKHLKRLIRSIKAKFPIQLIIPKGKFNRIEVILPSGDVGVPQWERGGHGYTPITPEGYMGVPRSSVGVHGCTPIKEIISEAWVILGHSQAKLKSYIQERLLKAKQRCLRGQILKLSEREKQLLRQRLRDLIGCEPKGRALSGEARCYAMLRFLQAADDVKRPQAWLDNVARQAERDFEVDRKTGAAKGE